MGNNFNIFHEYVNFEAFWKIIKLKWEELKQTSDLRNENIKFLRIRQLYKY